MKRILSILLALCLLCSCSPQSVEDVMENSFYEEDALFLVKTIEDTHPCFVLDDVPEGYEAAKAEYLESVKAVEDDKTFYELTSKYCVSLKDGHTAISAVARISDLYLQNDPRYDENSRKPTREIMEQKGSLTSLPNRDVELLVLSDDATYSAAMNLCIWVQDGKLGKIVGRGSSNRPNHYGGVIFFELPNLGWKGQVSAGRWIRPDTSADPNQIQPDVELPYGTDALEVALEMLAD